MILQIEWLRQAMHGCTWQHLALALTGNAKPEDDDH
jgi:hypothetical protein